MTQKDARRARLSPPADWVAPARTIVVIGGPRSGSTLLCALMAQTGALGRPDEFFKRKPYPVWALEQDDAAIRCGLARREGATPNGVCAMKLFAYHFERVETETALFDWFPNPFFVWIRRRDLLAQAISASIAYQTGRYRSFYDDPGITPVYSRADILQRLEAAASDEAFWRIHLARTGAPCHELAYEDLVAAPDAVVRGVAAAAGLDLPAGALALEKAGMDVQRSGLNDAWSARFRAEPGDPGVIEARLTRVRKHRTTKRLMRLLKVWKR